MPKVSVIMPVYNGSRYITSSVASVLGQTFDDFELVVINDGSTDNSMALVREFFDSRIRIIDRKENLGIAETRNEGVAAAKSPYVAMLDCDDIASPSRIEDQVSFLDQHPEVGLVGSWVEVINETGRPKGLLRYETSSQKIASSMLFNNRVAQSSVMMRRDILPANPYRKEFPPCEDYDLWVRLMQRSHIANIPKPLVKYRLHVEGTSRKYLERTEALTQKIIVSQVRRLGIDPDENEITIHRILGRGKGVLDTKMLEAAAKWVERLYSANCAMQIYDSEALSSTLGEKWFVFCDESSHLGSRVLTAYYRSPYRRCAKIPARRICRFFVRSLLRI